MDKWEPFASTTLIGSMPHKDRAEAIKLILRNFPEIPVWPQLPAYSSEQMMVQYLEGLPGIVNHEDKTLMRTDTPEFEQKLLEFYEEFLEVESGIRGVANSRFRFGHETGKTFFQFIDEISRASFHPKAIKGQVIGPFTLLAGLKDQNDRALLYDERIQDLLAKHLAMKARWQIEQLKPFADPVIIFLDEPALAGFGSSAFISVSAELIQSLLKDAVDAIHQAGGLAGVHVCANTDWLLAFNSGIDIINLDAYGYMDKFLLYKEALIRFFNNGGIIAWGIVPTGDPAAVTGETPETLANRWFSSIQSIPTMEMPLNKILTQSIFTPSCGCGSLSVPVAERVVKLTKEIGEIVRSRL